jgi:hypothetical protein
MPEPQEDADFWTTPIYGTNHHEPLVSIKLRDVAVMVSPAKAREMGMMLLTAAESAVGDGYVVEFFMDRMGLGVDDVGTILADFRLWRSERHVDEEDA